jgi:hypothetical protein
MRKYTSLKEQFDLQAHGYTRLVRDSADMENTLKSRILFLEQFKCRAQSRIARMQKELDESVLLVSGSKGLFRSHD